MNVGFSFNVAMYARVLAIWDQGVCILQTAAAAGTENMVTTTIGI